MEGLSLHLVEFIRMPESGEGDGAAVFVTSCDGPGKCAPWERQWWAGAGLEEGRAGSAGCLGITSYVILGCL